MTQHGRDQLYEDWHQFFTAQQGQDLPAEEVVQLVRGGDYGWPKCYFDNSQQKLVLAPEYGGDGGKKVGVCSEKKGPAAVFPGHWRQTISNFIMQRLSGRLSGRSLHRLPRFVEIGAGSPGRLQRSLPALRRRQGLWSLRGLRRWLRRSRKGTWKGHLPAIGSRRGTGRRALHHRRCARAHLARNLQRRPQRRRRGGSSACRNRCDPRLTPCRRKAFIRMPASRRLQARPRSRLRWAAASSSARSAVRHAPVATERTPRAPQWEPISPAGKWLWSDWKP